MEKKYLNFPVMMLKDLHKDYQKFCNDVFDIGIYLKSKSENGKTELARYKNACHFFGITQGNKEGGIINAKNILSRSPSLKRQPITGIEKDTLFEYYKNEKSEFDVICLSAFLGIKSIIGTKPYCKTNKKMIHARMFGYNSIKDLPQNRFLSASEKKYLIRWHMDKLLLELQLNWFLKLISHNQRGMYVSFDVDLNELAKAVIKNKQQTKLHKLRDVKTKALKQAEHEFTTH
jgi:hypothetical protein